MDYFAGISALVVIAACVSSFIGFLFGCRCYEEWIREAHYWLRLSNDTIIAALAKMPPEWWLKICNAAFEAVDPFREFHDPMNETSFRKWNWASGMQLGNWWKQPSPPHPKPARR